MARYASHCIIGIIMQVSVCILLCLLVSPVDAASIISKPIISKSISSPQKIKEPLKETTTSNEKITDGLKENKQGSCDFRLIELGSWFTGFVALLLAFLFNFFIPFWYRPKLKVVFEKGKNEYEHKILFDNIPPPIHDPLYGDEYIFLKQPGFNSRVKIINNGKSVAKNVQARLESIKFENEYGESLSEIFYHPTVVKWSGEKEFNKIDIAPFGSYFFLDLVYCINETYAEIINYYKDKNVISMELIDPPDYSNDVYWAVWVDRSYLRGIPEVYRNEGIFKLNYHVIAENCKQIKFTAKIKWEKSTWNDPEISIL